MFIFSVDSKKEEYICLDSQRNRLSASMTTRVSWYDDQKPLLNGNRQKTQIFLLQITQLQGFTWELSDVELFKSERVRDIPINDAKYTEGFKVDLKDKKNLEI